MKTKLINTVRVPGVPSFDIPPPRPARLCDALEAIQAEKRQRQHDNMNILDRARLLRSRK